MKWTVLVAFGGLSACMTTSTDPADGGFFNGVSGITTGTYQSQIDADEAQIEASRVRNANLAAQIQSSESELARLKVQIVNQRNALGRTDTATSNRINAVLVAQPTGNTDAARLAALQQSIADARALSQDLAKLSV
ncbi:hypothetical protein [uncultured Tateyamaria sp.]|uniref:hypothetical protein n=1 Tax=uncultured Tateyamaria sp. TaxID=455651 RepID=UPI002631079A|nr:hypothetical protein [uncultured Tateyamaria sp.]